MVGSHAGNTFSTNKGGAYVKRKPKGTNPRTTSQVSRQSTINMLSQGYSFTLSDAERAAWRTFAATTPVVNKIGNTTFLSAQQMFIKLNAPVIAQGNPANNAPPISTSVGAPTVLSVFAASSIGGYVQIELAASGTSSSEKAIAFVSPPLNPGRNYVSSQLRQLPEAFTLNTVVDVTSMYLSLFGLLPTGPGQRLFVRAYVQDVTTGVSSAAIQSSTNWV